MMILHMRKNLTFQRTFDSVDEKNKEIDFAMYFIAKFSREAHTFKRKNGENDPDNPIPDNEEVPDANLDEPGDVIALHLRK